MSKILNLSIHSDNIGDLFSRPCLYFDFIEVEFQDFHNLQTLPDGPVILGGGGLTIFNHLDHLINKDIVVWGVGHNAHFDENTYFESYSDYTWPAWINHCKLIGVRDINTNYRWVPCASCMHCGFDKKISVKNKVVAYDCITKNFQRPMQLPFPTMNNSHSNINEVLNFLGSAEIIITNSYHGMYWGTLLGKRIIVADAWSTKFFRTKFPPTFVSLQSWELPKNFIDYRDSLPCYPSALEECRKANLDLYNDVKIKFNM